MLAHAKVDIPPGIAWPSGGWCPPTPVEETAFLELAGEKLKKHEKHFAAHIRHLDFQG